LGDEHGTPLLNDDESKASVTAAAEQNTAKALFAPLSLHFDFEHLDFVEIHSK
jgi:hypothetical protein